MDGTGCRVHGGPAGRERRLRCLAFSRRLLGERRPAERAGIVRQAPRSLSNQECTRAAGLPTGHRKFPAPLADGGPQGRSRSRRLARNRPARPAHRLPQTKGHAAIGPARSHRCRPRASAPSAVGGLYSRPPTGVRGGPPARPSTARVTCLRGSTPCTGTGLAERPRTGSRPAPTVGGRIGP